VTERGMIGGCFPPVWPRPPRPPVPEPDPDSLDETVDWMTYSHPELYSMVHSGLDLTGAMSVSATWARLGAELGEIGDELAKLLVATSEAWEGESADLARGSVSALADWAGQTGARATEVSACVTIQVDNANTARNAMPPPPYPPIDEPMHSQVTAFTGGDFHTAGSLVADPTVYTSEERALHQQAARTMARFQESSRDVYATVPQFVPPDLTHLSFALPEPTPTPTPQPVPPPPPAPASTPAPAPPPVRGGPVPGGPGPGPVSPGPGQGTHPGPGGSTGAAPVEPSSRPAAASAGRAGQPSSPSGMGGMPMGGAGGARDEDTERRSKKYLESDEDLWGLDEQRVVPPVIGEVNRRA
jgi:hypothetical protein